MADISALSSLLKECATDKEPHEQGKTLPAITPGSIGPAEKQPTASQARQPQKQDREKSIWQDYEVPVADDIETLQDARPPPRYEIYHKQHVGTEDVFLGMSDVSPSSNDCTHLVVKIHFPGCGLKDLDLNVTKRMIRAESPKLRLNTYLPLPVDSDNGSARFDTKKELLIVTLPILLDEL